MIKQISILAMAVVITALGGCSSDGGTAGSPIKLNELLAASDKGPDWLELHNTSGDEVSLVGFELRDSSNFWLFPAGTTIPGGGFLQVIADGTGKGGKASFKLKAKGERLQIRDANGTLIDQVIFPAQRKESSWGRIPDGIGAWKALDTPTPNAPNDLSKDRP